MSMDFLIPAPLPTQARNLIRRAGYAEFRDPNTGETSYVRRISTANFFPRYHVYMMEDGAGMHVSLHLDQKKASYSVGHKHSGEYSGTAVEQEAARMQQIFSQQVPAADPPEAPRGFFSRFFS